jgi:hypothetical protein
MMLDLDIEHLRRDYRKFLPLSFLMGAITMEKPLKELSDAHIFWLPN